MAYLDNRRRFERTLLGATIVFVVSGVSPFKAHAADLNMDGFQQLSQSAGQSNQSTSSGSERNPFGKSDGGSATSGSDFKLTGLVVGSGIAACLINHSILFVGDTIGGYRVATISKNGVLLKSESGKTRHLHLVADAV